MPTRPLKPYQNAAWRRLRVKILERDGYLCQIRLDECTNVATCVDHIMPVAISDPSTYHDPDNLRAACKRCNGALGARLTNARRTAKRTRRPAIGVANDPRFY